MTRAGRWLFWGCLAFAAAWAVRGLTLHFSGRQAWFNLGRILRLKKPQPASPPSWPLAGLLKTWNVQPPLRVALPPQYAQIVYGNAGLVLGNTDFPNASFVSAPFPHPGLHISRAGKPPYEFDSRSINAVLVMQHESRLWPYGYTAFIDLVHEQRQYLLRSPVLTGVDGKPILAVRVRSLSKLNEVLSSDVHTLLKAKHWAPLVWEFPREGRLQPGEDGMFAVERDGTMVSWLPPLPADSNAPLGLMLLQKSMPANPPSREPEWWELDQKIRQQVLAGAPLDAIKPLLEELDAAYPGHPLLAHYQVVARLHGGDLTRAWLEHQRRDCDLTTWQLLPWTTATTQQVRALPCLQSLPSRPDAVYEHLFGAVLIRFRDQPDDSLLAGVAGRLVRRSYLHNDPMGFNFALTDFAALWAVAHP